MEYASRCHGVHWAQYSRCTCDRRLAKSHFGHIEAPLVGLDRDRCVRVAPKLEQIMRQTYQTPFTTNVGQAAQQKPAETTRFFDLPEHRFHDHFASDIQGSPRFLVLLLPFDLWPWWATQPPQSPVPGGADGPWPYTAQSPTAPQLLPLLHCNTRCHRCP